MIIIHRNSLVSVYISRKFNRIHVKISSILVVLNDSGIDQRGKYIKNRIVIETLIHHRNLWSWDPMYGHKSWIHRLQDANSTFLNYVYVPDYVPIWDHATTMVVYIGYLVIDLNRNLELVLEPIECVSSYLMNAMFYGMK